MIRFSCQHCGKALRVGTDKAGRRVSCPGCGNALDIPTGSSTPSGEPRGRGPAYCTDWRQLDALLGGHTGESQPDRFRRASEDRFRAALTAHADAVPGHAVERLGDAIVIESVEAVPVYRVRLDSLYECRLVEPRQQPHAGEPIPPATVTSAWIDAWAFDALPPEEFKQATDELAIEASQRVVTCERCRGHGGESCNGCSGTGKVTCGRCSGRGNVTCPQCGGDRKYQRVVRHERQNRPCDCGYKREYARTHPGFLYDCGKCDSSGWISELVPVTEWVPCGCGLGVIHCPGCGGQQHVNCSRCAATGRLLCEGCRGFGHVVSYLAIVRAFAPASTSHAASEVKVPGRLLNRLDADELDLVIDLRATDVPNLVSLTAGPMSLRDAIEQSFAESVGGCPADHRIARQRLTVGVANIHRVEYQYGGKSYSAWWLEGAEQLMVPISSPLADTLNDLIDEALQLWEAGEQRAAALKVQDATEMAKSDRRCREALDDRRADIPPELWRMAGRVFSPTRAAGRAWKGLKRNPALLVILVIVGGSMLFGVAVLAIGMLAGPKGQPRQQVREVRDTEPVRDPRFEERRPREEPRPAVPDRILSADYWPTAPDTTRLYDDVQYEGGRVPGQATRKRVSYLADGVVETSVTREGTLESGTLLGGGKITWRTMTPQPATTARIRRTAEFIEYGVIEPSGTSWLPVLKLGARIGDSWTYPVTDGTRQRDRMVRFDLHRGRPSVVIEGVITAVGSDDVIGETVDVLVRGVGLVERKQFVVHDGRKVLVSERVRVEE